MSWRHHLWAWAVFCGIRGPLGLVRLCLRVTPLAWRLQKAVGAPCQHYTDWHAEYMVPRGFHTAFGGTAFGHLYDLACDTCDATWTCFWSDEIDGLPPFSRQEDRLRSVGQDDPIQMRLASEWEHGRLQRLADANGDWS